MDLLLDIGNTSLKWATSDAGALAEMRSVRHHGGLPIDLHAAWELLDPPERILAANVGGPDLGAGISKACRSRWGLDPVFAATEPERLGVTIAYERPEHLGVDRWLTLLVAHRICPGPALIVDAGTAITYDALLADGRHLGGLILPGLAMMRDGLLAGTHIPRVEPRAQDGPWATDTASAIATGPLEAASALAQALLDHLQSESGDRPALLLTGGDAEQLLPALAVPALHRADLVLRGLALLA